MKKITGKIQSGSKFSFEPSPAACQQMSSTPNKSPQGKTLRAEMETYLEQYLGLLELAFVAPEPLRRSFVAILEENTNHLEFEMREAVRETHKVFNQRVAPSN